MGAWMLARQLLCAENLRLFRKLPSCSHPWFHLNCRKWWILLCETLIILTWLYVFRYKTFDRPNFKSKQITQSSAIYILPIVVAVI